MARNTLKNIRRLINDAPEAPVESRFVNDLKRSIEICDSKSRKIPSKAYKPSSMQCVRNMYYQRIGVVPDASTASACLIGICESGTDRHIRVQNAISRMKECGIDCEYIDVEKFVRERNLQDIQIVSKVHNETKLYNTTLDISFMCDGIIRYCGHYYILEIKTESIHKWVNRTGVDSSHRDQAIAYSLSLKVPEVLFLYINRDNCDMKAFVLNVTQDMVDEVCGKIQYSEDCIQRKTVPAKPDDLPRKVCEYCNYKTQCRKDG